MGAQAISGNAGSVIVYSGTVPTVVGEIAEWSLDISHSPVETTAFGDNWADYVPSIRNATGSFQGNHAEGDAGQVVLDTAILDATSIALDLMMDGSVGYSISKAYLTSKSASISQTGKADTSYNFQNAAAVTMLPEA